jgi:hypothetical protein
VKQLAPVAILGTVFALLGATSRGPAATSAAARTQPCKARGYVGFVRDVPVSSGFVNGASVSGKTNLRRRALIGTSGDSYSGGQLDFCLTTKKTECTTMLGSKVRIKPRHGVLVRFIKSYTTCSTNKNGASASFDTPQFTKVVVHDPVFAVDVRPGRTIVTVLKGVAKVVGAVGPPVVVGPGEQTTVPAHEQAPPPHSATLTGRRLKATNALANQLPKPNLGPPPKDASPAVTVVFNRGLIVEYDDSALSDDIQAKDFIRTYFTTLARRWGIGVKVKPGQSLGVARRELTDGAIDLYVSPYAAKARVTPRPPWPFLQSNPRSGTPPSSIYLVTRKDDALAASLKRYLVETLQNGSYGALYTKVYDGAPPPYKFFAPLLLP